MAQANLPSDDEALTMETRRKTRGHKNMISRGKRKPDEPRALVLDARILDSCEDVAPAVSTLQGFITSAGEPLRLVLAGGNTRQAVENIVTTLNLEVVSLRSYSAGAMDRALKSVGIQPRKALFVTSGPNRAALASSIGLTVVVMTPPLVFGAIGFAEWSECPLVVAHLVPGENERNLESALRFRLAANAGLEDVHLRRHEGNTVQVHAREWVEIDEPSLGLLKGVHVQLPISADVVLENDGRIAHVVRHPPSPGGLEEARHFVQTLSAHRQIADSEEELPPGATHIVETDSKGRRKIQRRRFSAL